ncbi:MAG: ATP synthase F1 subunit epsilon [Myxococcales bacterium]|nr:ATP synthase F1 subunit epsilon [Myxococcales bacterium]
MALPDRLQLEVATPKELVLEAAPTSVTVPSVSGEFGVLPLHLPLLTALKAGVLQYNVDGKKHVAAVGPGFVEAGPEKVLLLTDQYATPDEIDADAEQAELAAAEAELKALGGSQTGSEWIEASRRADWARAQLQALAIARAL